MKVSELIHILQKCDQDLDVIYENGDYITTEVKRIFISKDIYWKDSPERHVVVIG